MTRLVVMGVVIALGVCVLVLGMIRSRRLQERHAMIWLLGGVVIVLLGAIPALLAAFSRLLGIAYPPSALFLVLVGFLGVALLDATLSISRLTNRMRSLAQRVALMDEELRRLRDGLAAREEPTAREDAPTRPAAD
ncbi:MAG: DUF2304 domain-containing protein [Thermoleophilia bacterium]